LLWYSLSTFAFIVFISRFYGFFSDMDDSEVMTYLLCVIQTSKKNSAASAIALSTLMLYSLRFALAMMT